MRKYMTAIVAVAFLLFTLGAMAQTSSSSGQYGNPSASTSSQTESNPSSSTTTQSTTTSTSTSGEQRSIEGCVVQEQGQFFLIPKQGNPLKLQAASDQDLKSHEGQQVSVSGTESSLSASAGASTSGGMAGTAAGTSTESQAGVSQPGAVGSRAGQAGMSGSAAGTSDLKSMADRQLSVQNINKIASTCPSNWNPSFPQTSTSGTSAPSKY
ncbi:MAG: hypothetical protein ACE14M_10860 [Terriglobales bacterium]